MPLGVDLNLPTKFPTPQYLTLGNFKRGVITLIDKSRLPKDALEQADNLFLVEDGQPSLRPGVAYFGTAPSASAIDGFDYYDTGTTVHLVCASGGSFYRSTDDAATWTVLTGATYTAGTTINFNQHATYLYITDGTNNIARYDGTLALVNYTSIATPAAPTPVITGGGAGFNYYYKIAAVNTVGFSIASPATTAQAFTLERSTWVVGTNKLTLTMPISVATQTRWDIFLSTDNVNFYYLSSTATDPATPAVVTWIDDGTSIVVPSTEAPVGNTTQGPKVKELTNVGSRMYGVRDTVNQWRIWFSSGSPPLGAFSSAYDGGYLDWNPGGKYKPVKVVDYRDGKGTPLATVFCDSADGQGCILQMSLDVFTIGDISITVPSAYKLPGSRGTPAPDSVINVLNDYMFYNSQAFYNLGSRQNFQNLLSTDEASANIRPTVKQISTSGEANIASAYFDAKVYFSVGIGSSTNNQTVVYDTERKAWLPKAFDIGFKKFLRYTTTTSSPKLLALRVGDTKLSEISTSIQGDYGVAFTSVLKTGLYPTLKNRFGFQWTEQAEMEFSNPTGEISVELIGIERNRGFSSQGSTTVTSTLSTTGWDTFLWDTTLWDDTSTAIDTFSESTVKRYFRLGRELNAVQWMITTNTLDANYVLRTLQTWGTDTNGGLPRGWRLDRI
jgi:hypothetical protein